MVLQSSLLINHHIFLLIKKKNETIQIRHENS